MKIEVRKLKIYRSFSEETTAYTADFFNAHTVSVAVEVPTLIREVRGRCRDVREHDETYCATCGLRWSNDEEKPECPK